MAGEPVPSEWFRNDSKLVNEELTSISVYRKNASVYSLKNAVLSIPKVYIYVKCYLPKIFNQNILIY